ncbi:glycosyltransferase family 2 protein [Patescibacteria group bacterium]|nr:glycosyltransferase family 2 protein [Patescibacteria group bacterium]
MVNIISKMHKKEARERNKPFLSVIIPIYNEEAVISASLEKIEKFLEKEKCKYEIIVVDDGSTDLCSQIVEAAKTSTKGIRLYRNGKNLGKGAAIRRGIKEAQGDYIFYTDADLQIQIEELKKLINALQDGFDIAIASRRLFGAEVDGKEPRVRMIARFLLSFLVKIFICHNISDSQCGFKCFTRSVAQKIFNRQSINGYGFDLEILYIANKLGYKIKDLPVRWAYNKTSKVKLLKDGIIILKDIIKINFQVYNGNKTKTKILF